jgi:4-hydroxybenzoate polyprenyltransferase
MNHLRAYAQLVRLPNVFTALADIGFGALAVGAVSGDSLPEGWWLACVCLGAASACLYSAGMVWNDVFDLEQDRRERPFRPLPSRRVSQRAAVFLGIALLAVGVGLAFAAGWRGAAGLNVMPGVLAALLAVVIVLYNGEFKQTWGGPVGMGACRFLNVLLGLSPFLDASNRGWGMHAAGVVGIYIMGVTWLARKEAETSRPLVLAAATVVMAAGLLLALPLPLWFPAGTSSPLFPYLLAGLGFLVGIPTASAIARPTPALVQAAVKRAILALIVLDATLATVPAGTMGLLLLVLLLPALYLGRWIYST